MSNFIVIVACLIGGALCKRVRAFPSATAQALNAFVIYVSLPALMFTQVPKLLATSHFEGMWWAPASMPWLMFILSFVTFVALGRKYGWSRTKIGALVLTAGLGNTSFVGFPLLEALIGPHAIPVAILADQLGSFLVLSTIGIGAAAFFSGAKVKGSEIAKRIYKFPPFLALLVVIPWTLAGSPGLATLTPAFEKIAATLVPLALFAVGFQLKLKVAALRGRGFPLVLGLVFKLLLGPLVSVLVYIKLAGDHGLSAQVTVLECAMAPMITAAVVAMEFDLDAELANLMVGVGIPLSILTTAIWFQLLKGI